MNEGSRIQFCFAGSLWQRGEIRSSSFFRQGCGQRLPSLSLSLCTCIHIFICTYIYIYIYICVYIYIYMVAPPHVPTISLLVQVIVLSTQSPLNRASGKSSAVLSYTVAKSRNPKDLRTLLNQQKLHTGTQSTGKSNKSST